MTFRPYPGVTIAAAIAFAILVGLGVWQLHRLEWKLALIAGVNAHMAQAPIGFARARALGADAQYRHVALDGRFDHAHEAYVFTTGEGGAAVYHVLTPLITADGALLVDRGMVPKERLDPATRAAGNAAGPAHVVGVWRLPDAPGFFTPPPDRRNRIWYARDVAAIAAADHVSLAAPVVIEANAAPNPGGWPKGGQTVVTFRNSHLEYAVTWFGLAATLVGVWLAFHISKGRLALR